MARKLPAPKKQKSFKQALWGTANKLRESVEPPEFKHAVFSLFFLTLARLTDTLLSKLLSDQLRILDAEKLVADVI